VPLKGNQENHRKIPAQALGRYLLFACQGIGFAGQAGFFPSRGIFMNNAFGDCFVNNAAGFGQEGVSFVRFSGLNRVDHFAGCSFYRRAGCEVLGASFSVSFHAAF